MSVSAMTAAMYHSRSKYATRLVLIAVANFDNPAGSFASLDTLGRLAGGLNRRTVQRSLDELVKLGELKEITRPGQTNLYRVEITCPDDCDRTTAHRQVTVADLGGGLEATGGLQTAFRGGVETAGGVVSRPPEPKIIPKDNPNFSEFWEAYPRKLDKGKAERAFRAALKRASFDEIMAGVIAYRDDPKRDPNYTKYPATWLNSDSWENATAQPDNEAAERARAKRERELEQSAQLIAEMRQRDSAPPPQCEHGANLALCRKCVQNG